MPAATGSDPSAIPIFTSSAIGRDIGTGLAVTKITFGATNVDVPATGSVAINGLYGTLTIFAPSDEFYKAKTALLEAFPDLKLDAEEITFLPQSSKTLSAEELPMFTKLIDMLNECDDVQDVYHNVTLPS